MTYDDLRPIDKIQYDVMETLRNCHLEPDAIVNVLLSISLSIANETKRGGSVQYLYNKLQHIENCQSADFVVDDGEPDEHYN